MSLLDPVPIHRASDIITAEALRQLLVKQQIDVQMPEAEKPEQDSLQICVNRNDAERATALILTHLEKNEPAAEVEGVIAVVCEECGTRVLFPAAKKGKVQECPTCDAYLDVDGEIEEQNEGETLQPVPDATTAANSPAPIQVDLASPRDRPLTELEERGRSLLQLFITSVMMLLLVSLAIAVIFEDTGSQIMSLISCVSFGMVSYGLYFHGAEVILWIEIAVLAAGGVLALALIPKDDLFAAVITVAIAVQFWGFACLLYFSTAIASFMAYQRAKYEV